MSENKKTEFETNVVKPEVSYTSGGQLLRMITTEDEIFLDGKLNDLQLFTDFNHGLGKSEKEKDELYHTAQTTWREYVERLKNMNYSFFLNRKQYNFLTNLLLTKLEYDVNTVFLAVELTNMLGSWELSKGKKDVKSDTEVKMYTADATEITYMYHLIAKHTVKGITHDTYTFTEILRIIGRISKIVSYYDSNAKSWNKDVQDWASTFDEGVYVEGKSWGRKEAQQLGVTAFGTKVETKKSKKKEESEKA